MFVIKDIQLEAYKKMEISKFVEKSKLFLQQNFEKWCKKKKEEEIEFFIHRTIEFGAEVNVRKQNMLQKLMFLQIEYRLKFPLNGASEKVMLEKGVSEEERLTKLFKKLEQLRKEK